MLPFLLSLAVASLQEATHVRLSRARHHAREAAMAAGSRLLAWAMCREPTAVDIDAAFDVRLHGEPVPAKAPCACTAEDFPCDACLDAYREAWAKAHNADAAETLSPSVCASCWHNHNDDLGTDGRCTVFGCGCTEHMAQTIAATPPWHASHHVVEPEDGNPSPTACAACAVLATERQAAEPCPVVVAEDYTCPRCHRPTDEGLASGELCLDCYAMDRPGLDPTERDELAAMRATIGYARADAAWCREARPVDLEGARRAEAVVRWAEERIAEIEGRVIEDPTPTVVVDDACDACAEARHTGGAWRDHTCGRANVVVEANTTEVVHYAGRGGEPVCGEVTPWARTPSVEHVDCPACRRALLPDLEADLDDADAALDAKARAKAERPIAPPVLADEDEVLDFAARARREGAV